MFSKQNADTTKPKSWRGKVFAVLAGVATIALGTQVFEFGASEDETRQNVLERYTQTLVDHGEYAANQVILIDQLIKEGVQQAEGTRTAAEVNADALVELNRAKTLTDKLNVQKKQGLPGLADGAEQLKGNVKWGEKTGKEAVDPAKIAQNFADSGDLAAEINKMFPKSWAAINKLRQDLKIHTVDLRNTIQDVKLLATTTKENLGKSIRKLELREKYDGKGKLNANMDEKIWRYEIKYQVGQLEDSLAKCQTIIGILKKLQEDCARTQDDLENELEAMKVELKRDIDRKQVKITDLEAQLKALKCEWWKALLTLGIACIKIGKARSQLEQVQREFSGQLALAKKINGRMDYFDGLVRLAAIITSEASGLLETTKKLENVMKDTKRELEEDFTDEAIEDSLWDEDFANDFAEGLWKSFDILNKQCDFTIHDCVSRTERLTKALVGVPL